MNNPIFVQVDHIVGKDHLFKRSIILIKAWCYYESRILGAHHGLISTYALETLVLYIFHLFHSSLDGPLAVSFLGLMLCICRILFAFYDLMLETFCILRFCTNFWIILASLTGKIIVLV